jgi:hypothetical protein
LPYIIVLLYSSVFPTVSFVSAHSDCATLCFATVCVFVVSLSLPVSHLPSAHNCALRTLRTSVSNIQAREEIGIRHTYSDCKHSSDNTAYALPANPSSNLFIPESKHMDRGFTYSSRQDISSKCKLYSRSSSNSSSVCFY